MARGFSMPGRQDKAGFPDGAAGAEAAVDKRCGIEIDPGHFAIGEGNERVFPVAERQGVERLRRNFNHAPVGKIGAIEQFDISAIRRFVIGRDDHKFPVGAVERPARHAGKRNRFQ